jgi:Emfourin
MKLAIVRGGGIAGIATRTELDSAALPPAEAEAFAVHVQRLPQQAEPPPRRHADEQLYALIVSDEDDERTLRFSESTLPEAAHALLAWVDARPERDEQIELPGA